MEARRREQLLFEVGLIQVGPPDGEVVPGVLKAARLYDLAVEELAGREVESRFPGFSAPEPLVGVFERQAGYLLVERAVMAQAAEAERHGADLRSGETVLSWRAEGDGVVVETDRDRYSAGRLIVSAGLVGPVGRSAHAAPERDPQASAMVSCVCRRLQRRQGQPTFLYELPEGVFYGFPQIDERGVKVAEHTGGGAVPDPLLVDRGLDTGDCVARPLFAANTCRNSPAKCSITASACTR